MINISFSHAYRIVVSTIHPLKAEEIRLEEAIGRATAEDILSLLDSPSADVSLKDGFAVISEDIKNASADTPITLTLRGSQFAGMPQAAAVSPGKAVKITSGAIIPPGADGVLANEFAEEGIGTVTALAPVGNNILRKGTDLGKAGVVLPQHTTIMPTQAGLIAAAGHAVVTVYRRPRVTVVASGDEIVAVGHPVGEGKVAASNLVTLAAWCSYFSMQPFTKVVPDSFESIREIIEESIRTSDCIITSGGAWSSERDLIIRVLDDLGWKKMFYRVRIGPGKAVGFGFLEGKPVFCLPGGPPSNQMAFLQLALPGLRCLGGHQPATLPVVPAILDKEISGQIDWTQYKMGMLHRDAEVLRFEPRPLPSRLQMLSNSEGIATIPEGVETIPAGTCVDVQVMGLPSRVLHQP